MKWWFGVTLWKRVLGALVLGIAFGLILTQTMGQEAAAQWLQAYVQPVGDLFIRLIRMIVPQHGAPLAGPAIRDFIAWTRSLACGIDLMGPDNYRIPA